MENKQLVPTDGQDDWQKEIKLFEDIQDNYTTESRLFVKYLRDAGLPLDFGSIEKYLNGERDRVGVAAYNKKLAMMKRRLRDIFDTTYKGNNAEGKFVLEGFLTRMKPGKLATTAVDEHKILLPEDYEKLIAYEGLCTPIRLFAKFLWVTGCRISETIDIRLKNVKVYKGDDYNIAEIRVIGKGFKERKIKILEELYNEINGYFEGKVYLFEKPNGRQYKRQYVSTRLLLDGRKAIGKDVSAHRFRHGFATRKYQAHPESLAGLSKYLGHSKVSITSDLYIHTNFSDQQLFED